MLHLAHHKHSDLIKAEQIAVAAEQTKGAFLANMSHEIRTPMNGILGMADILSKADLKPEQREYLEVINSSGETLLRLIDDILDFSKIEAGKLEVEETDFDVVKTVENLWELLSAKARAKGIEVRCHIGGAVPTALSGDPARLSQVLANLVGNAIKFTAAGEVLVDVALLEHDPDRTLLRFQVRDTGIGIATDRLEEVFEAFTQGDASTTRRFGGTGLGLTISRRLVDLMGGSLTATSTVGEGSTFEFALPFRNAKTPALQQCCSLDGFEGSQVLIIDEDPANRWILQEMIAQWGFVVSTAESGSAGVQSLSSAFCRGEPFALVVVNGQLAGADTVRMIRATPGCADLPVVVVSSSDSIGEGEAAIDTQSCVFVARPAKRSRVFNALVELLAPDRHPCQLPEASGPALSQPSMANRLRVLVVDDNLINRKVARHMLVAAGHEVVSAEDGEDAISALTNAERPFDLVLMDVQMPKVDGFEATRLLRKDPRWRDLPIVAMTAHALSSDRELCLAAGMNDYVSKPINRQKLLSKLLRWAPTSREERP
jgi:two-component system sensor histidine kinase/response regulator